MMTRANIFRALLGIILLGLGLSFGAVAYGVEEVDEAARQKVMTSYGKLPLYFIENKGQLDPQVKYYTKTAGQTLYFTNEKIVFDLFRQGSGIRDQGSEEEK